MVQSNKILTVSYGTFSCTLEGFDDAFGTMKAIAEYFRDLAAEDRYFGAEPPQPDAEMLAHIAQQEIARRVDARQEEGSIVLRAQDAATVAAPVAEAAVQSSPQTDEEVIADQEAPVAETPVEEAAAPEVEDVSDLIAVELAEAEVAEPAAEAPAKDTEAEAAEDAAEASDEDTIEVEIAEYTEEGAAAFFAGSQTDDAPVDEAAIEPAAEETPVTASAINSIASKLQRIRAVVSKTSPASEHQDFSEDEHADLIDTPDEAVDAKTKITEMLNGDAVVSEAERESEDSESELLDDLNQRLEALDPADHEGEDVDQKEETVAIEEEDLSEDVIETADNEMPETQEASSEVEDAPVAEVAADETTSEDAEEQEFAHAPEAEQIAAEVSDDVEQPELTKVSKEEFDAILASDRGEDLVSDDLTDALIDEASDDEEAGATSLSDKDEEELMRELAELEAEMGTEYPVAEMIAEAEEDEVDSIFAEAEDEAEADPAQHLEEERALLSDDVDSEDDVSRLLEEADDKLSDVETSNRRTEFAHLRAAMAAGKAEEAAGGTMSEAASDGAYREDLARVVKPRRPDADEANERSRRPEDDKPAPLKLVAAQRIDTETAPVQPQRVISVPMEDTSEDGAEGKMKFADYADSVGAHDLPDLLEAAAAYLSFVEGQEQFSRPQLMTKVRTVDSHEFSREDGLRSFGLLLRDGKIEKTQAGRFTVSDRIGFRPEDMRAAG